MHCLFKGLDDLFSQLGTFSEEDDKAQRYWTTAKRRRRGGQSAGVELRGTRTGRPPLPRWVGGLELAAGLCADIPQGQEPAGHTSCGLQRDTPRRLEARPGVPLTDGW